MGRGCDGNENRRQAQADDSPTAWLRRAGSRGSDSAECDAHVRRRTPRFEVRGLLKKAPTFVLALKQSSTYPHGKERVLARLGREGEIGYASGVFLHCGLAG